MYGMVDFQQFCTIQFVFDSPSNILRFHIISNYVCIGVIFINNIYIIVMEVG